MIPLPSSCHGSLISHATTFLSRLLLVLLLSEQYSPWTKVSNCFLFYCVSVCLFVCLFVCLLLSQTEILFPHHNFYHFSYCKQKGCGGGLGAGNVSTYFIWLCGLIEYMVRTSLWIDRVYGQNVFVD